MRTLHTRCILLRCLARQIYERYASRINLSRELTHAGYFALAAIGWHDAYALLSGFLCVVTLATIAIGGAHD